MVQIFVYVFLMSDSSLPAERVPGGGAISGSTPAARAASLASLFSHTLLCLQCRNILPHGSSDLLVFPEISSLLPRVYSPVLVSRFSEFLCLVTFSVVLWLLLFFPLMVIFSLAFSVDTFPPVRILFNTLLVVLVTDFLLLLLWINPFWIYSAFGSWLPCLARHRGILYGTQYIYTTEYIYTGYILLR